MVDLDIMVVMEVSVVLAIPDMEDSADMDMVGKDLEI